MKNKSVRLYPMILAIATAGILLRCTPNSSANTGDVLETGDAAFAIDSQHGDDRGTDAGRTDTRSLADVRSGDTQGVSVTVDPSSARVNPGAMLQFSATVTGASDQAVTWSVEESAGGSIGASTGLYRAPTQSGTYHVTATSHADPSAVATGSVTVNMPGACAQLPAAGTWESISPVVAQGEPFNSGWSEAVVVDPFDPATVWLGTGYRGFFKSTDCGATWTHMNTGRNSASIDRGGHNSMAVDPSHAGVIYMTSLFDAWNVWKTTNGGQDWDPMLAPDSEVVRVTNGWADSVSMDPHDPLHLSISFHGTCSAPYDPTCEAETTDGGTTWRLFHSPHEPNPNWEEGAGPFIIDATTWLYGGEHLWLTTNSGVDWSNVTPSGTWSFSGGEVETHSIPRASDGSYYLTSSQGIVRSVDSGRTWTLIPNSGGRMVGFAMGGGHMFASDQWSGTYRTASETDSTTWTAIAAPPAPGDGGAPYLDYDPAHHVLYSSNFAGGLWRIVTP